MARLLIVDDEPEVLQKLRSALERKGHEIDTASNGAEALAQLQEKPAYYDLVVSDILMPEMDGLELLACLRRGPNPLLQTLPAVLLFGAGWLDSLWKDKNGKPIPFRWGDDPCPDYLPDTTGYTAYSLDVSKKNRPNVLLAVEAALKRYCSRD